MKKITIFICFTIFVVFSVFIGSKFYVPNMDFSVFSCELWDKYPNMRYQMVSDFEQKYTLDSLTKDTVMELLGEKGFSSTENMYSYYIGGKTLLDSYYSIIFDENGQCISRSIYTD